VNTSPATSLRGDVVAGLTTAAVVIPKSMAFPAIAGLPLEIGLYTALIPPVVYAARPARSCAGRPRAWPE
jgi:MFS superfamily sulfate permease-like transporter